MKRDTGGGSSSARAQRLDGLWATGRPPVMGIVNCTPDSFYDGGVFADTGQALHHARALRADGAAIIDVGGESTRPGSDGVTADVEAERVLPVIRGLRERDPGAVISVDTSKPAVAEQALELGADLVNDVHAGRSSEMFAVVAEHGGAIVLMHMRGEPRSMQQSTSYDHVVAEVHEYLRRRAEAARAHGIPRQRIWIDPGIGFAKDDDGNLALLRALPTLASLGHPVVVGSSRKSFIGRITGAAVEDRLPGSLASLIPTLGLPQVVVRVHDVRETIQFLEIARRVGGAAA